MGFTKYLSIALLVLSAGRALASDSELVDVSTEMEELTSDSEAAIAQAKATKIRIAKETAENERKLAALKKARVVAKEKRAEARNELKHDEITIDKLMSQQASLKQDLQKSEADTVRSEKAIQDSHARTEKKQAETLALQNLKAEKLAKFADSNQRREAALQEGGAADQKLVQAQAETKQATEDEHLARKNYEKTVVEEAKHKARTQDQITALKLRYQASKLNVEKLEKELTATHQKTLKLEAQAAAGLNEVERSEKREVEVKDRSAAEAPARALDSTKADVLTLKRDCKIHDGPSRTAKVLGVKLGGQSISEGNGLGDKGWVGFPLEDGQRGFVATSCF